MGQKRLPLGSGIRHVRAFERFDWVHARTKGDHAILEKPGYEATLSIPLHKELDRRLLAGLLKAAGVTEDEYLAAYK